MRTVIAIILILLVTFLFFREQIGAWFSRQGEALHSKVEDNLGRHSTVDGVKLRHYGSITVSQEVADEVLQMDLDNATISLSGSDSEVAELLIGYWEYAPGDASFRITSKGLVGSSQSGKPVLITSVDGSVPKALSLIADFGNGEIKLSGMSGSKEIRLDTGNGAISVEACEVRELVLDTGNGSISLSACVAERVELDTGNGNITVSGSKIGFLEADTGMGNITLQSSQIREKQLDTGMGNIIEK